MKRVTPAGKLMFGDRVLRVNNGGGRCGCYLEILTKTADQLEAMQSHHNRVLVVRFDLHLSEPCEGSELVSRFVDKIKRHLAGGYRMKRVGYVWVREQEKALQPHYHVGLFVDGNKIQYPQKLLDWVSDKWEARGQPKPFIPKNCYKMVERADPRSFSDAFYRMSYLAKERGKGSKPRSANDYSTSRIKRY